MNVDKDTLWNLYLDSFPPGTNEIYRERREMDCSCCRHFVRQFGNVVTITPDNQVVSLWDFTTGSAKYDPVLQALAEFIHATAVSDVFFSKDSGYGTDKNRELFADGTVHTWSHFRLDLPAHLVDNSSKSVGQLTGAARDVRNVFHRSLEEISLDAVETVLDLIVENTLYRGEEWQPALRKFQALQQEYYDLPDFQKNNYCWRVSLGVGEAVAKIRNHSIGVLLQNLTAGTDTQTAVRKFATQIMAPDKYKQVKIEYSPRCRCALRR